MKKIMLFVLMVLLVSVLLLFVSSFFLKYPYLTVIAHYFNHHHYSFMLIRYGIYIITLIAWPFAMRAIGKRQHWPDDVIAYFSKQRLKLLTLFIIIELFFINNVVGYLFSQF